MNQQKTSAQFKALAKEQLLGNYGKIAGAFAVIIAIYFSVFSIAYAVGLGGIMTSALFGGFNITSTMIGSFVILVLIMLIIIALFYCMEVGLIYMSLQIARGNQIELKDVFFAFSHHPDKVLGLFFLFYFANILMSVPACIVQVVYENEIMNFGSPMFWLYLVLYLASIAGSVMLSLVYGLRFYFYCDHPEWKALNCAKQSRILLQGQKGRFFYIGLSFIGWYCLVLLSCGLAILWVGPYAITVLANFYRELNGELEPVSKDNSIGQESFSSEL